jgi:hypothetical protein
MSPQDAVLVFQRPAAAPTVGMATLGVDMLYRTRDKYHWLEMQTLYPFSEHGISRAVADAMAMKTVKSTTMPWPDWQNNGFRRNGCRFAPRKRFNMKMASARFRAGANF